MEVEAVEAIISVRVSGKHFFQVISNLGWDLIKQCELALMQDHQFSLVQAAFNITSQ